MLTKEWGPDRAVAVLSMKLARRSLSWSLMLRGQVDFFLFTVMSFVCQILKIFFFFHTEMVARANMFYKVVESLGLRYCHVGVG